MKPYQLMARFAGYAPMPPVFSHSGALVYKTSDSSESPLQTWDAEAYDVGGWHSTSSNTARMTVPSGVTLVRAIGNAKRQFASNVSVTIEHEIGGASFHGRGAQIASSGATINAIYSNAAGAPVNVSAGNYFNQDRPGVGTIYADAHTWFAVEAIDPTIKRALVRRSSSLALSGGVTTAIPFDTEVYDEGGWFDSSASTTAFTVPAGTSGYARFSGGFHNSGGSFQRVISITKAGTLVVGSPSRDANPAATAAVMNCASAVLPVSAGDTFELTAFSTNESTVSGDEYTWFSAEEIKNFKGCLAYKSGSQSVSANTETALNLESELYDTEGAHSTSSNTSRIVVPSGITQARASFSVSCPSESSAALARVLKNGSAFYGSPAYTCDTPGADFLSGMGAWVDVAPGDYFQLAVTSEIGRTFVADTRTWLCVEFR